jgi:cell division protein FtsZ
MIDFDHDELKKEGLVKIKVIGIGGAGGNTINSIIEAGYHEGIECIAANTDEQALEQSKAAYKIHLGVKSTKGLGTGANPDMGKRAAEENLTEMMERLEDADIVFLTAGMGGGTGSGALPVVARALKEKGILSISVVTKPFIFEGKRRAIIAEQAIAQLRQEVDILIIIPNQKLLDVVDSKVSMIDAFGMINEILGQSVKGISEIITKPGHINVDFADVRTIMKDRGLAIMGTARATGPDRAGEATIKAITSPLLENMNIQGARSVLLNITGSKNLGLHEISQAASLVYEQADADAQIILGSVIDESLGDAVQVTIIATGFVEQPSILQQPRVEVKSAGQPIHEIKDEVKIRPTVVDESALVVEPVAKAEAKEVEKIVASTTTPSYKKPELEAHHLEGVENDLDVPAFLRKNDKEKENH